MKTNWTFSMAAIFFMLPIYSQDFFLDSLQKKSEIICHIKVTEITGGGDWDVGATEFSVTASIIYLYKGLPDTKDKLEFAVVSHTPEFERLELKKEYIVFLIRDPWILNPDNVHFTLADFWFGIQPYYKNLHNKLVYKY